MKILLAITFVFGILRLFAHFIKSDFPHFFQILFPTSGTKGIWAILNLWFFYFSIIFQAYYWLFK